MSDHVEAPQPAVAPVAPPAPPAPPPPPPMAALDLGPFKAPTAPTDPTLRSALLNIGVQAGVLMLRAGTTPEDVAKKIGLPNETVYQIMIGREEDIGVRALSALAKMLNGKLVIQLVPDQPAA